ncbi:MAG: DUF6449 domain-containing protein [Eubacteriales bacterium]|nr:DUF6449 domain-containing protein [Eubacteriales bacterium]
MKSRTLSFDVWKELWKKQIWVFALSCLAYFMVYPVMGMINLDNILRWGEGKKNLTQIMQKVFYESLCGSSQNASGCLVLILYVGIALGVLCAIQGFSYLHARRKVDFYHSLPIRREKLLLVQTTIGMADYLVPATAFMLLLMCVGVLRGAFTMKAFAAGWASVLAGFIFFLLAYALAALAMLLTGRILVGICGTAVLFAYIPALAMLLEGYASKYFDTFCMTMIVGRAELWAIAKYGSPISWAYIVSKNLMKGSTWMSLAAAGIVAVLILLLDVAVYRRRSSEMAGNSMAFDKPAAVIRVLLVTVLTLASAGFFGSLDGQEHDLWMIFGYVFGLLLSYAVVQMIYYLDIRKIFAGKGSLLLSAAAAALVIAVFRFDLVGYDAYVPKQEEITNISMDVSGFQMGGSSISTKDRLAHMKLGCDEQLYGMTQQLAKEAFQDKDYVGRTFYVYVCYECKNGKKVYRQYSVPLDEMRESAEKLYDYPELVNSYFSIAQVDDERIGSMSLMDNDAMITLFSEKDEGRYELVDAIKEDLKKMNSTRIREEIPVGMLNYNADLSSLGYDSGYRYVDPFAELPYNSYDWNESLYIYPSFTKTLAFLEKMGYKLQSTIDSSQIKQITVWEFSDTGSTTGKTVYTEKEDIETIAPKLLRRDCVTFWQDTELSSAADVVVRRDDGGTELVECSILK